MAQNEQKIRSTVGKKCDVVFQTLANFGNCNMAKN